MPNSLSTDSAKIVARWFEALDSLLETGEIDSVNSFSKKYKFSRPALTRLRHEPSRKFELHYLYILVNDFGIKAHWLVTGNGPKGF